MDRDKKNIAIFVLSIALVSSGIGNLYLSFRPENLPSIPVPPVSRALNAGTIYSPWDLDSINSWDSISRDIIQQVCEGLYTYNLSDPNLGIVSRLAVDYGTWDSSKTLFTVPLRRNISFHDGTPFNAEAVKWNFERINWFMNASGTLNTTLSQTHSLWEFPNGTTILDPTNPVTINSEYSVTINLRSPYVILESLLCHESAFILSPNLTPKYEYISTAYGRIVGTGPFVYDYYIANSEIKVKDFYFAISEIKLHRWDDYWREPAFFEELTISLFEYLSELYNAFLDQSIDYLLGSGPRVSVFCGSLFTSSPTLLRLSCILEHITYHTGIRSLSYNYLGMNNKKINKTWRQAISYAIDYTYIIEELYDGTVCRSNGPLAPNFPMYDPNIKAATWDLAKARQILVDAGITTLTANNDTSGPIADAWKAADFQSWNYSYNIGNDLREDLGVVLKNNLDLIGIEVIDQGMSDDDFINRIYNNMEPDGYDSLELYWSEWGPDYLSPYNMIASLFSNKSAPNSVQYHNHTVETWLDEILSETNATKRAELYSNILHQIVEVDMPQAFGFHSYLSCGHSTDLKNVPYNSLMEFDAWSIYRDLNS